MIETNSQMTTSTALDVELNGVASGTLGILNPSVAQTFARHPVYDSIFSSLTPASFARMSQVCRDIREVALDFATRAYNINRRLSYYFSDPLGFRSLMARNHLLISGSFALQFFDRTFYPTSDLDIYISTELWVPDVASWLKHEGYMYRPSHGQRATVDAQVTALSTSWGYGEEVYNGGLAVRAVFSFEKRIQVTSGAEIRKIQLVVPSYRHSSPLQTILGFHSSM